MLTPEVIEQIATAARNAGLEPAALLAVIEVESNGKFFAPVRGRNEPLIRFEGHYFDRRLDDSLRARARAAGLSSPLAGKISNPGRQANRWDLLDRACVLARSAALESTSWGIGQIMGAHWKALGFGSVEELVSMARDGAPGQIELLLRFIKANHLIPALNARDWAGFARRYNGPGYRKNAYDTKLSIAYARHKSNRTAPATDDLILSLGEAGDTVRDLQLLLSSKGFPAPASGIFDARTKSALMEYQSMNKLVADGIAGPKTLASLRGTVNSSASQARWYQRLLRFIMMILGLRVP